MEQGAEGAAAQYGNKEIAERHSRSPQGPNIVWTAEMKARFLDHLAATCNVAASVAAIGLWPDAVYRLRRRSATFRRDWAVAVESGYQMLETQLIGHALAGGGPVLTNGDVASTGPIDTNLAMALLSAHRNRRDGRHAKAGPKYKVVTREQTDASILRKLKAMSRNKKDHA